MAILTTRPRATVSAAVPRNKSFVRALALFKEAARRIPAYKDFLQKAKIDPDKIETKDDFLQVPPTDKPNYISAYDLKDLSWDGTLSATKYISSSSGSTGIPFYWPRSDVQNSVVNKMFQRIFEDIFETKKGNTLFIDVFALGTWIAGLEFYNAAKFTADAGNEIAIATPGIEKAVAIDTVKRLAPSFDRLILAGYPPFLKDVIESGAHDGIDWKKYDVRFFSGGEPFSERWRSGVLKKINKENSLAHFINIYGMAETGVVGHETPLSIAIRRSAAHIPALKNMLLTEGDIAPIYQYDPLVRYLEVGEDDGLMLTTNAGLPLIRYNTRDRGGLFTYKDAERMVGQDLRRQSSPLWQRMPFVYLFGRRDLSISLYALNIYVENIKHALETWHGAEFLSGLFTMRVLLNRDLNQRFEIVIELARGIEPDSAQGRKIAAHIVQTLRTVNSEYAKLYATIGRRAIPKVTLVRYGQIETMPGRKHRWVKRA